MTLGHIETRSGGEGEAVSALQGGRPMEALLGSLMALIRERDVPPGARLPSERDLAQQFRMSRNTVREALTLLEAMRVVERRPNSGIYLRLDTREGSLEALVLLTDLGLPLNERDVGQMAEVRALIESQAVALACLRRSQADLLALRSILERTARKLADNENVAEEDAKFHLAILAATGNDILVRLVTPIYLISRQRRHFYFGRPEHGRRSLLEHRKILKAIDEGNAADAVSALHRHLGRVEAYWTDFVRQQRSDAPGAA